MNTSAPILKSASLELRPLELADSEAIQALFPHWEIVRYLATGVPWPYPADGALTFVRDVTLPAIVRGEEWAWSIRLRGRPDQLIGVVSLRNKDEDNRGFWLGTEWHGCGYMSEACDLVTSFWFDVLGFPCLRVPKAVANTASRRISKRQGMRVVWSGEKEFVSGPLPAEVWEISAEEWRARERSG